MNRNPQFEITINREPEGTTPNSPFHGAVGKRAFVYSSAKAGEHDIIVEGHREMYPMSDEEFDRLVKDGTFSHSRPVVGIAKTAYLKSAEVGTAPQIDSVELNISDEVVAVRIGDQIDVAYRKVRHHNLPPGVWKIQVITWDEKGFVHVHLITHSWGAPAIERELDLGDFAAELSSKVFKPTRRS